MQRDINSSIFNQATVRRLIIYGIMTLILGCAQCAFFPMLDFCPKTPDLIMGMLLTITLLDSEKSAAICSIAAGFFLDSIGSSGLALSPLIYLIFVLLISVFTKKMLRSFASYLLLLLPMLLYRAVATYLCIFITDRALPSLWMLGEILLPEAIATGLLCMPIYFIVKMFSGALSNHSRFTF